MTLEEYFGEETLVTVTLSEFKTFEEKIDLTKKHDGKAHIEILDNKYIYTVKLEGNQ